MPHSILTERLRPPRARLLTAATALLSVTLAVAGCGGSSSPPGVAQLSSGKDASSASSESSGSSPERPANPQQAMLAFAKCMRANGVSNFPDPNPSGGFLVREGLDRSSPLFEAAQAKCHKLLPGGGPPGPGATTNPSPHTLAKMLNIARCMREHGIYDFPDPRTSVPSNPFGSGTGVISDIEGVILVFPSTIDQQSPTFTRAAGACAFPLHNH
jgi:hypothetical protein